MTTGYNPAIKRNRVVLTLAVLAGSLLPMAVVSRVAALDATNFQIRSAADLVALCSAQSASSEYVAAIHFCHGFVAGAYQYYATLETAAPAEKFVCAPSPPPTRNQVVTGYVIWARANPEAMRSAAIDSLFRYLSATYPC